MGIMLTVTIVQSMFIGYLLLAKRIEGYIKPEVDEEVPAEGHRLKELDAVKNPQNLEFVETNVLIEHMTIKAALIEKRLRFNMPEVNI